MGGNVSRSSEGNSRWSLRGRSDNGECERAISESEENQGNRSPRRCDVQATQMALQHFRARRERK